MDLTAPAIPEPEKFDDLAELEKKAQELTEFIRKSKHFIAFTGAGVSTSAGIPDFRGPDGNWTLRAQGRARKEKVNTLTAVPTPTHMALVELQNRGILKYLVSQNCDGLHRRSGILPDRISELHGNSNREYCKICRKEYIRDFRAVATYAHSDTDHRTGRKCTNIVASKPCNGALHDSIINFGEYLEEKPLELAYANARKADLCLVLGSSLRVPPASNVPTMVGKRKAAKLVICNLQDTDLDDKAKLRIHSRTDDLMMRVMQLLDIPIPSFVIRRRLVVEVSSKGRDKSQLSVHGVDVDGTPVSFLQSVKLEGSRRPCKSEPFLINFTGDLEGGMELKFELEFMGHYGESNLEVTHRYDGVEDREATYLLSVDPMVGEWKVERLDLS